MQKMAGQYRISESRLSVDSTQSKDSVILRNKSRGIKLLRPCSLKNLINGSNKPQSPVLESVSMPENNNVNPPDNTTNLNDSDKTIMIRKSERKNKEGSGSWNTEVTIVLVEAKALPPVPDDGVVHSVYCKFQLGSENYKTKCVVNTQQPEWRERLKLRLYKDDSLNISLWDKGKQKNFMGSCILDLSKLERERTHEIWQELDSGFGLIHMSVTMCVTRSVETPLSSEIVTVDSCKKHAVFDLKSNWKLVGVLYVKVIGAKGLSGRPNAYCTLELDNERVQTHRAWSSSEPVWNKNYQFNVYDVTSTLDLKIYGNTITNAMMTESIGKVQIPLLRIVNGEMHWYALKDRNKRNSAKGNCPRILLQMSMIWNPVKATVRLFQPKEAKYIKKSPKFDVALVYSNVKFIKDIFVFLYELNESFKRLFEWEDQEFSFIMLLGWLAFCSYFKPWTAPLFLVLPFFYHWFCSRHQDNFYLLRDYKSIEDGSSQNGNGHKDEKRITSKILDLQDMTLTVTKSIEYLVSLVERINNLVSFKVPFLSYLTMLFLVGASFVLYWIPFNYLLMALGIYKFTRKYLNPTRKLNNDLLDFISRVPDNITLKDWKELSVPEPNQEFSPSNILDLSVQKGPTK